MWNKQLLEKIHNKLNTIHEIKLEGSLTKQAVENLNAEVREHKETDIRIQDARNEFEEKLSERLSNRLALCPKEDDINEIHDYVVKQQASRTLKDRMIRGSLAVATITVLTLSAWIAWKSSCTPKEPTGIIRENKYDNHIKDYEKYSGMER